MEEPPVEAARSLASRAQIAFARIDAQALPPAHATDWEGFLLEALLPGTFVQRYNRVWRMGQTRAEGTSLVGRIGFQGADITELWNDEINDFEESQLQAGTTSPFAIDPRRMRVAFQLRAGVIRAHSFTGALQALMNKSSPLGRWRVGEETETTDWEGWLGSVDRVTTLRIRLERPNPNYHGRERVENIVEGTNAALVDFVAKAPKEQVDGIDVDDALVSEMIEHADDHGSWNAVGEREVEGRTEEARWNSEEATVPKREVPADPTTREAASRSLRRELGDSEPEEPEERE